MNIQFTMVNYHFITYFGFRLVFFGGLDFELCDVVGLIFELVSSVDRIIGFVMLWDSSSCVSASSFPDFLRFSKSDAESNLIGV